MPIFILETSGILSLTRMPGKEIHPHPALLHYYITMDFTDVSRKLVSMALILHTSFIFAISNDTYRLGINTLKCPGNRHLRINGMVS